MARRASWGAWPLVEDVEHPCAQRLDRGDHDEEAEGGELGAGQWRRRWTQPRLASTRVARRAGNRSRSRMTPRPLRAPAAMRTSSSSYWLASLSRPPTRSGASSQRRQHSPPTAWSMAPGPTARAQSGA
jgi:hypothetical protein